jgi:hypothetical protein
MFNLGKTIFADPRQEARHARQRYYRALEEYGRELARSGKTLEDAANEDWISDSFIWDAYIDERGQINRRWIRTESGTNVGLAVVGGLIGKGIGFVAPRLLASLRPAAALEGAFKNASFVGTIKLGTPETGWLVNGYMKEGVTHEGKVLYYVLEEGFGPGKGGEIMTQVLQHAGQTAKAGGYSRVEILKAMVVNPNLERAFLERGEVLVNIQNSAGQPGSAFWQSVKVDW